MYCRLLGKFAPLKLESPDCTSDRYWTESGKVAPSKVESLRLWMYSSVSEDGKVTPATDVKGFPPRKSCVMVSGRLMPSKDEMPFQLRSRVETESGIARLLKLVKTFDVNVLQQQATNSNQSVPPLSLPHITRQTHNLLSVVRSVNATDEMLLSERSL